MFDGLMSEGPVKAFSVLILNPEEPHEIASVAMPATPSWSDIRDALHPHDGGIEELCHHAVMSCGKPCSMFYDDAAPENPENHNAHATRIAGKGSVFGTAILLPFLIGTERLRVPHPDATAGDPWHERQG